MKDANVVITIIIKNYTVILIVSDNLKKKTYSNITGADFQIRKYHENNFPISYIS